MILFDKYLIFVTIWYLLLFDNCNYLIFATIWYLILFDICYYLFHTYLILFGISWSNNSWSSGPTYSYNPGWKRFGSSMNREDCNSGLPGSSCRGYEISGCVLKSSARNGWHLIERQRLTMRCWKSHSRQSWMANIKSR